MGQGIVVHLDECASREQAARFLGLDFAIRREQLPELPGDEHYWADLLGLEAITLGGERLGIVVELIETGSHDVLVVHGARRYLVPFVTGVFVHRIDLSQGQIEIDWRLDY